MLKDDIRKKLNENISQHIGSMASELNVSVAELLKAFPSEHAVFIDKNEFTAVWEQLTTWTKALFFLQTADAVLEVSGPIPKGSMMGGMFNLDHLEAGVGGHLMISRLGSIFLVNKPLFNRESLSVHFCSEQGHSMFSVYAGRGKDRSIVPEVKEQFMALWQQYYQKEGTNDQ